MRLCTQRNKTHQWMLQYARQATELIQISLCHEELKVSGHPQQTGKRTHPACCCCFCRFMTTLELAVRFGKTLVVEEADSIEPLMYPLLTGDMQGQGSSSSVKIGDRIVDYNKDFRLMLVTRNSRPQLAVDAAALLCLVNFTVTRWVDSSQQLVGLLQVVIHMKHALRGNTAFMTARRSFSSCNGMCCAVLCHWCAIKN